MDMLEHAKEKRALVTGAAGFIGACLVRRLLADGFEVIGVDNLNNYYDTRLKNARLRRLCIGPKFLFFPLELADKAQVDSLFGGGDFDAVIHLAAQSGSRKSVLRPDEYVSSNLIAFTNVLEGVRHCKCRHFLFASSSSVYGVSRKPSWSEDASSDRPGSLYAATKKSNEILAHSYSQLFRIPTTALRFFSVYGPWGRPDTAIFKFVDAIMNDRVIELYNAGRLWRDFIFIDDVVDSILRLLAQPPGDSAGGGEEVSAPMRLLNVGSQRAIEMLRLVEIVEACLHRRAKIRVMPMQKGDVFGGQARADRLVDVTGYVPSVTLEEGLRRFVDWYLQDYVSLGIARPCVSALASRTLLRESSVSLTRMR
jgi:UDP-glucuronate 4-epimerase